MNDAERDPPPSAAAPPGPVASPCILVCQLDASRQCCIGCRRTREEIRDWPKLSDAQKRALLALLPGRSR